MIEFAIGDNSYRSGPVDVFTQAKIAKRLLPMIAAVGPDTLRAVSAASQQAAKASQTTEGEDGDALDFDFSQIIAPISDAIRAITDEDMDFIWRECLKVTKRKTGDAWASVWNRQANGLQFDDIGFPDLCQIAFHVMSDNLASFWKGRPDLLAAG